MPSLRLASRRALLMTPAFRLGVDRRDPQALDTGDRQRRDPHHSRNRR
jgi:hypothetical protein